MRIANYLFVIESKSIISPIADNLGMACVVTRAQRGDVSFPKKSNGNDMPPGIAARLRINAYKLELCKHKSRFLECFFLARFLHCFSNLDETTGKRIAPFERVMSALNQNHSA